jgi:hypothetical protein
MNKHKGQSFSGAAGFFLAALLALVFLFAACESPAGNGENDITWTAQADGENGAQNSTVITFTFSAAVEGLSAGDITLADDGGSVAKGSLTNTDAAHWSLGITVTTAGNVKVSINKTGIETTGKNVAVYKEDLASLTHTVTFDKNGGTADAEPRQISVTWPAITVDLPTPPSRDDGLVFKGWNTEADGSGAQFTAGTEIRESITVYALWGTPLGMPASVADLAGWLSAQTGGSQASPVNLALNIDLGDMADGSNWHTLLDALDEAKQYVALDLSDCAMTGAAEDGTVFRPNYAVVEQGPNGGINRIPTYTGGGKAYIVELTLPLGAKKIFGGWSTVSAFIGFDNLEKIRGDTIEGAYTETGFSKTAVFIGLASLKEARFEKLTDSDTFFQECRNLESVYCPSLVSIGLATFYGCANLKTFDFSNVQSIVTRAFAGSGLVTLDLSTSQVTKIPGHRDLSTRGGAFNGCSDLETILFPVCLADIGNDKVFKRGGWPFANCPKIREVSFLGDPADIAWLESGPPYDTGLDDDLITLALSGATPEERTGTYVKNDGVWSKKP